MEAQIGRGGMGVVFRARQISLDREVAIKFLSRRGLLAEDARFNAEARLLAQMTHPNIVQIHGSGWLPIGDRVFPYLVMQYSGGVPLDQYCREQALTLKDRLHIMLQVMDGVQHAHSRGITHRDLKPSNILVTASQQGRLVQLIDFGLAGREEDGCRGGTQGFMAPELSSGSLIAGPITDVYALGVVLHMVLGGAPPRGDTPCSSVAAAQTKPPVAPADLRGDLDRLCAKALATEPGDRYQTVQDLAADVRAWFSFRPLQAVPATLLYRTRKALRRHRGPLVAALVVMLLLFGAVHNLNEKLEMKQKAIQLEQAKLASDQLVVRSEKRLRVANKLMLEVFRELAPGRSGGQISVRSLLARVEELVEEAADTDAALKGERLLTLSKVCEELGVFDKAHALSGLAADLFSSQGDAARGDWRLAMSHRAYQARRLGKLDEAEATYRMLLAEPHDREKPEFRLVLQSGLSDVYLGKGENLAALELAEKTLAAWQELAGQTDLRTLAVQNTLARVLLFLNQGPRAERLLRDMVTKLEQRLPPDHPRILAALGNLAWGQVRQKKGDEKLMREVLQRQHCVLGIEHPDTLTLINLLANHLAKHKRFAEASEYFAMGYAVVDDQVTKSLTAHNWGNTLNQLGAYAHAEQLLDEALAVRIELKGATHQQTMLTRATLAEVWTATGRVVEAEQEARLLFETALRKWGPDQGVTQTFKAFWQKVRDKVGPANPTETASIQREPIDATAPH
nr:serine/threonine-protein kinase [Acanthopleuribacter pedis]